MAKASVYGLMICLGKSNVVSCPFTTTCINKRNISPVSQGAKVEVVGISDEDECMREIFVEIVWDCYTLAVPLSQLKPIDSNDATLEATAEDGAQASRIGIIG